MLDLSMDFPSESVKTAELRNAVLTIVYTGHVAWSFWYESMVMFASGPATTFWHLNTESMIAYG